VVRESKKGDTQLSTFAKYLRRYFSDYGGYKAVVGSPLFLTSLLVGLISYRSLREENWPELAFSIIPNLLGFSLGTYALLFSLISPRIRLALRSLRNDRGTKYLDEMNATFLHFIIAQVICILWSFLYRQSLFFDISSAISGIFPSRVNLFPILSDFGSYIGIVLIIYSLLLVIGSSLTVYRIARITDPDPS